MLEDLPEELIGLGVQNMKCIVMIIVMTNLSPVTKSSRLYDSNYYVINSEYKVYVCIDNGSSGINTTGNASLDEPTFTDLEPTAAGVSGDGYVWKYLFQCFPK